MTLAYRADGSPMPTRPLTKAERAREPRSLAVVAWFDGWGQGQGMPPGDCGTYPRRLDAAEQASWREGFTEGRREAVCLRVHGFAACADPTHAGVPS